MDYSPLLPLLADPVAPLHGEGIGYLDELLPAALAIMIGIGVYTLLAGGGDQGGETRADEGKRPRPDR